jgi:hypothetical protein
MIEVTQADRERADLFFPAKTISHRQDLAELLACHRIEAQRPLLDALELISKEAELADVLGYGWKKARKKALSAIKQARGLIVRVD